MSVVKVRVRRVKQVSSSPYRAVDFHANQQDFQCVMLAAIGWTTRAIAAATGLTEGQVSYRITKSEHGRKVGDMTARQQYRNGSSPIASAVVATVTKSTAVRRQLTTSLDKRGLYNPRPRGVIRNHR